jgi:ribosomal protein L7/L12
MRLALASLLVAPLLAQAAGESVSVAVDSQRVIKVPAISRIAVSDPAVAEVSLVSLDSIQVSGLVPGKTTLLVEAAGGKKQYAIEVTAAAAEGERAPSGTVELTVGAEKVVNIKGFEALSAPAAAIAEARSLSPTAIAVRGNGPGETRIAIIRKGGEREDLLVKVTGAPEAESYQVVLVSPGPHKERLVKEVRAMTGLSAADATALVNSAPSTIKEKISREQAEKMKAVFTLYGAVSEIK